MNQISKLLLFLWVCVTISCTPKLSRSLMVETDHIMIAVNNLDDENWTPDSKGDRVITKYTLISFTSQNEIHQQASGIEDPFLFDTIGQVIKVLETISVNVPSKGHLVFAVSLQEDNDLSNLTNSILDPEFLKDIVTFTNDTNSQIPGLKPYWLGLRTLDWDGVILNSVDILSSHYEFLASVLVINENQLQSLENKRISSFLDTSPVGRAPTCHYAFNFRMNLLNPEKEDKNIVGKAKAPNFIVSLYPFIANGSLNSHWLNSTDPFYQVDPENENRYIIGEGLFNKELSVDISLPVSPPIRFGSGTASRFLMLLRYTRQPYLADLYNKDYYFNQDEYFSIPEGEILDAFTLDDVELDFSTFLAGPYYKIFTPFLVFDIGGGIAYSNAKVRLHNLVIENPNIEYVYDEKTNVLEKNIYPYALLSAGLGRTTNGYGFLLNVSTSFLFPDFTPNSYYKIYQEPSEINLVPIQSKQNILMGWNIGFSFLF